MKRKILAVVFFSILTGIVQPQSNSFNCYVPPGYKSSFVQQQTAKQTAQSITSVIPLSEVIIVAKDYGSTPDLPPWFDPVVADLPNYFSQATFGNYSYSATVLKDDNVRAYIMPTPYNPLTQSDPTNPCAENGHVFKQSNILNVLQQADADHNFANYAVTSDTVIVHFVSVEGITNRGTVCSVEYISNDLKNGKHVIVRVESETSGVDRRNFYNVFVHESGHHFFQLPDMDHGGNTVLVQRKMEFRLS